MRDTVRLVAAPMPAEVAEIRLDAARWAVALALAVPGSPDEVAERTGLSVSRVADAMSRLHRIGLLREAHDAKHSAPMAAPAASDESDYAAVALHHLIEGVRDL